MHGHISCIIDHNHVISFNYKIEINMITERSEHGCADRNVIGWRIAFIFDALMFIIIGIISGDPDTNRPDELAD